MRLPQDPLAAGSAAKAGETATAAEKSPAALGSGITTRSGITTSPQTPAVQRGETPAAARISLGLTGVSLPTREQLRFQLDHALARDAVHAPLDSSALLRGLAQRGLEGLLLHSAVAEGTDHRRTDLRRLYLRRPDLGRRLHADSVQRLHTYKAGTVQPPDVLFVIADGLSALAVERHALPLLDQILLQLGPPPAMDPVCIVTQARVAIGDEIGQLLGAPLLVLLIGERPGLSSPDSLGVYLTWDPRPGRTDAQRNCISNVRLEGLGYAEAAQRVTFYMQEARRLRATGFALKENSSGQNALAG